MYTQPKFNKANKNDFQVGMTFNMGVGMWSNTVSVIKVTDKAIQVKGVADKVANIKSVTCWFPKAAIMWREGEEMETAEIAKWMELTIWQEKMIGMAE